MSKIGIVSMLLDFETEPIDRRIFSQIVSKYSKNPKQAQFDISSRYIKAKADNRKKDVIDNIKWANKNKVDLLIFPGWTICHPSDLKEVAKHVGKSLYVILELFEGTVEYRNSINNNKNGKIDDEFIYDDPGVFVLNNKKAVAGPIYQLISAGSHVRSKREAGFVKQLKTELERDCIWDMRSYDDEHLGFAQGRWLDLGEKGKFLILLCGEANLTNDKTHNWLRESERYGFDKLDYTKATAILNPSHTPSSKYMVEKRYAWSKLTNVPLLTCSNIRKQLRLKGGKFRLDAAVDGTQIFTKDNFFKIKDASSFSRSKKDWIEVHNAEKFQRAIVTL